MSLPPSSSELPDRQPSAVADSQRTDMVPPSEHQPRVSIGMPVYNGERFLPEALDSLLGQTFEDFELIISDNASTDRTEEICRAYAAKDKRMRYYRSEKNRGAAWNFNRVLELSSGEYFKWAAHDDMCAPTFLEKCVSVLAFDRSVVLCYARAIDVDGQRRFIRRRPFELNTRLVKPHERLRNLMRFDLGSPAIFGVIRMEILKKTPLIGSYYASDQVLLAELILHGRFHEIPEDLLVHREHPFRSVYVYPTRHSAAYWWDPDHAGCVIFPKWRIFIEYLASIMRSPISWSERIHCGLQMANWAKANRHQMIEDVIIAAKQILDDSACGR